MIKMKIKIQITQALLLYPLLILLCSTSGLKSQPSKDFINNLSKLILTKLGLSKPPTKGHQFGFNHKVKEHSVRAWKRHVDIIDQQKEVAVSTLPARITPQSASHLVFPFNADTMFHQNYTIKSAKLNFIPRQELIESKGTITIFRKKVTRYTINLVMARRPLKKNRTLQINIIDDITAWQRTHGSKAEYRLKLKCSKKICIDLRYTPFIELEYEMKKMRPNEKNNKCNKDGCCRKTVNVSIKDLGWEDWFFMPSSFDFHYCSGKCEKTEVYDKLLESLENSTTCCAPTGLDGFRVLYTTNGFIYEKYLHNVMASGCACGGIAGV